jgi:2,5-furandicarboxylate decarboxylase 1
MTDLKSFLNEHQDEMIRITKPVKLEHIPALVGQAEEAIVFDNIEGYPDYRLTDQLFVNRKAQARVLGCEPDEVVRRLSQVLFEGPKPLTEVTDAACQERIFTGDDIDLSTIPVVTHTDSDPYPYITGFAIHRDPDTGRFNAMFPRTGVLGKAKMVTSYVTPTAAGMLARHRAAGTKMPQAITIGVHPAWELAACYSAPHPDWWELELFETITGQSAKVVKCKTVDLVVPADASIVIEGYVSPTETAIDGPNPGPNMLFCPHSSPMPVFEVTAITMRSDPIYRHHQTTPFTDHQEMPRLFHEAIIMDRIKSMGLNCRDVHFPTGGAAQMVIIQVDPVSDGQVTDALLSCLWGPWANMKMAIAVDPDIDIYSPRDMQFALSTRVDPGKHVTIVNNARIWPFDPSAIPVEGAFPHTKDTRMPSTVGKWAIDATKPVPYRAEERKLFERAWPTAWNDIKLEDYLD